MGHELADCLSFRYANGPAPDAAGTAISVMISSAAGRGGEIATNRVEDQEATVLSLYLLQNCLVYVSLSLWCLAGLLLARLLRTERHWRAPNAMLGLLLVGSIIPMW